VLSAAYHEVADILGEDEAIKIFVQNPGAVIENREIA